VPSEDSPAQRFAHLPPNDVCQALEATVRVGADKGSVQHRALGGCTARDAPQGQGAAAGVRRLPCDTLLT
jgi:hypothetical protein